ncbi:hypothetical protein PAP18089_05334 [Pandoraea apista]|uniref:Uncharacterized protein n=1 Tax=Pandoraea apista TaxID=93218 RepID=A0A5E5PCH3_9BURK|nr:hypothetical protein PAP18089_05334 [Pandoraea apista]
MSDVTGMPLGKRPVCDAVAWAAPRAANHALLNACCAWALCHTPLVASATATACMIGETGETRRRAGGE